MPRPRRARPAPGGEGKISRSFFRRVVRPHLGRARPDVLTGPQTGVDVGVVRLAPDRVLLATTDPLYIEPRLGWDRAAWFAFQILASDLTTTGRRPDWATIDLDVPPGTSDKVLETILRVFDREARRLGTAIVTGHTGRYPGCAFPLVGSGTLLAECGRAEYITTRGIPAGAYLLVARTVALEATAMLATFFPERIRDALGPGILRRAASFPAGMTTVPDALRAASVGLRKQGVWAMHDATEGGVRTAAWEMAFASGLGLDSDLSRAWVDPTVRDITALFGIDPLDASSEGTLLLAVDPGRVAEVESALQRDGAVVSRLGRFTSSGGTVRDRGGPLRPPDRDSYWAAVQRENRRTARKPVT
ncbi:MAG TPA: AIR synthase-related protein [Thermoplasmata archaeon]|nr:AIR synthase-related protein [Thermoplasmata archaeon]